jgi:hypothetical protein
MKRLIVAVLMVLLFGGLGLIIHGVNLGPVSNGSTFAIIGGTMMIASGFLAFSVAKLKQNRLESSQKKNEEKKV